MNNNTRAIVEKAQTKDSLEQEFQATLPQRVARYLDVKPHGIVPNTHFASVSAECFLLYRDGHYYGTISLVQAVAEALVKFLCESNGWSPKDDYDTNLKALLRRGKITDELSTFFTSIWKNRNDYHHLNPKIEQDRQKLEAMAKNKLNSLKKVEEEIFAFSTNQGKLVPKFPKYWTKTANSVFLRLD